MTVGAEVRTEGMLAVGVFKMECNLGAVVMVVPDKYGMAAIKSLQ
jgi:hypothetical protein